MKINRQELFLKSEANRKSVRLAKVEDLTVCAEIIGVQIWAAGKVAEVPLHLWGFFTDNDHRTPMILFIEHLLDLSKRGSRECSFSEVLSDEICIDEAEFEINGAVVFLVRDKPGD